MIKLYSGKVNLPALKAHVRDIRPAWLLEEMRVPYERVYLDVFAGEHKTPEYKKLHPQGKVPAIVDGDFSLFESSAILNYLADKFAEGKLIPKAGTRERALHDQWTFFGASSLEPLTVEILGAQAFGETPDAVDQALGEVGDKLREAFAGVEAHFAANEYALGKEFQATDIVLTKSLDMANIPAIMGDYPHIRAYLERCFERPAYKKAYATSSGY